jgi:hypothetical protein
MKNCFFPLSVLICLLTSQIFASPTPLEIAKYGNKAVENRLKIKSWHVRIQRQSFDIRRKEEPERKIVAEYYVDGIKNRSDVTFPYKKQFEGHAETFTDITAEDGKNRYFYSTEVLEGGTPVALSVTPLNYSQPSFKNKMEELDYRATAKIGGDFRALGFVSTGLIVSPSNFAVFVQNCENRSDLKMEDDEIVGIKCKKISYVYRHQDDPSKITMYHRFWVAPEQGYSILRKEGEPGDHSFLDRTDVTVTKHEKTGLWVPVMSKFERIAEKDGKKFIKRSEYLTLEYLSLNENIPDETFTPATINIPVGRAVHIVPAPKEPMFWDGEKITSESGVAFASVIIPSHGNAFRYFLIAAGLALISIACLFKYFELRKK